VARRSLRGPRRRDAALPLATAGIAYVEQDRLKPDFEGVALLPASLKSTDLVEPSRNFKIFVGLSFGFWGGEDKFSGVVSGKKK
jgi:hypothetical protein